MVFDDSQKVLWKNSTRFDMQIHEVFHTFNVYK